MSDRVLNRQGHTQFKGKSGGLVKITFWRETQTVLFTVELLAPVWVTAHFREGEREKYHHYDGATNPVVEISVKIS